MKKHRARHFLSWCSYLVIYLLFTGSLETSELAAGTVTATIALLLVRRLKGMFNQVLHLKAVWLIFLWRIPFAMIKESWLLLVALARRLSGKHEGGHFIEHSCPGCNYDRHDAARRAFMTFGVCITPNSYQVSYDREKGTVLLRQLVGREISRVDRLFVELP